MYALTWHIKPTGNKVWSGSNIRAFENGMKFGFERMCIIHEAIDVVVRFLFMQSCIKNYINVNILTKLYFYVCRGKRPKRWNVKMRRINKTLS